MTEVGENTPAVVFDCGHHGDLIVWRVCPYCGRYIKIGKVFTNELGEVEADEWVCSKHGEINPSWEWL
jgi:hypothetical protein